MTLSIPPEGRGPLSLTAWCYLAGRVYECLIEDADADDQRATVRRPGQLFTMTVNFRDIQNVCLKYADGTIAQNFGAPRVTNPASLDFIRQYVSE